MPTRWKLIPEASPNETFAEWSVRVTLTVFLGIVYINVISAALLLLLGLIGLPLR